MARRSLNLGPCHGRSHGHLASGPAPGAHRGRGRRGWRRRGQRRRRSEEAASRTLDIHLYDAHGEGDRGHPEAHGEADDDAADSSGNQLTVGCDFLSPATVAAIVGEPVQGQPVADERGVGCKYTPVTEGLTVDSANFSSQFQNLHQFSNLIF